MAAAKASFSPALFDFLRELRVNNNRDWFQDNRARYETDVRTPALRFIEDLEPGLATVSPHLVADPRPVGGSMFRINRDIRFSADKSPYKTAVGLSFGHEHGRSGPAPGLYLHLEPDQSFAGGGIHMADTPTLTRIRQAIVDRTDEWGRIVSAPAFAPMFENMGESLRRAPQGFDPDHPHVEDLKRKGYTWHARFTEAQVCAPDFLKRYLGVCATAAPFHRFLATALGVDW